MLVSGRVLQFTVEADIYDFQVWYLPFGFWVSAFPGSTATILLGDFWLTHLDHSIVATIFFETYKLHQSTVVDGSEIRLSQQARHIRPDCKSERF